MNQDEMLIDLSLKVIEFRKTNGFQKNYHLNFNLQLQKYAIQVSQHMRLKRPSAFNETSSKSGLINILQKITLLK